ncbi:MAG: potassium-transporting ATPase subunit KdpC [Alphaproteobacteria bacterium]|nr:potassium-transporting ATPase subunit KdpC [Alphaproteobacteria bacterium]
MMKESLIAFKVSLVTILLTAVLYPLAVTSFSTLLFYKQASGSLIIDEQHKIIGSELIGQTFENPAYFFPRPSLTTKGYEGTASGGSNLGPTSHALVKRIQEKVEELKKDNAELIPLDLVTTSGSGLDPHISPEAAYWQAPRVALYRNVSLKRIFSIIDELIEPPHFTFLGEKRVNVLKLNITLNQLLSSPVVP